MELATMLFRLLVAHALADFSLQTDAMAKGKNRNFRPDYVPEGQKYVPCWPYWLTAHALIAGGGVYWATGNLLCGVLEVVIHWFADYAKCDNRTGPNLDQGIHLVARLGYLSIALGWI